MISIQNKNTRTLIVIMGVLVVIGVVIAKFYYTSIDSSNDPRVLQAREMYKQYNALVNSGSYEDVLLLLDSIENIYSQYEHYKNSFEVGVLYNNRSAVYLTIAMTKDSVTIQSRVLSSIAKDTLLNMAEQNSKKAIKIYENWHTKFANLSSTELSDKIKVNFTEGFDSIYTAEQINRFTQKRVDEIKEGQNEIKRRLSVAYTNMGIIYRMRSDYENALQLYKKAVDLWERNLTAQNNINVLLGRPLKKRNVIQSLFPPEKEEKNN